MSGASLLGMAEEFDMAGFSSIAARLRREAADVARIERALDEIARDAEEGAAMAEVQCAMRVAGVMVH